MAVERFLALRTEIEKRRAEEEEALAARAAADAKAKANAAKDRSGVFALPLRVKDPKNPFGVAGAPKVTKAKPVKEKKIKKAAAAKKMTLWEAELAQLPALIPIEFLDGELDAWF